MGRMKEVMAGFLQLLRFSAIVGMEVFLLGRMEKQKLNQEELKVTSCILGMLGG